MFIVSDDGTLKAWEQAANTLPSPSTVLFPPLDPLMSFSCGASHCLALTCHGKLYVWGTNTNYQLGIGISDNIERPRELRIPTSEKFASVHTHGSASYALTESGKLWVWGENIDGQCGINGIEYVKIPTLGPDLGSPIVDFAAGFNHVIGLTRSGSVWTWGSNGDGRLGVPQKINQCHEPICLSDLIDVARVFAGSGTSLVLTKSGALYIWGWNDYGILGKGPFDTKPTHEPHLVFPSGVREVACGWAHTLVLLEDGSLWSWGNHSFLNVGVVHEPQKIDISEIDGKIRGIMCGDNFSAVVSENGHFYVWGFGPQSKNRGIRGIQKVSEFKVKVPRPSSAVLWESVFRPLFLGRTDNNSVLSEFPVEVIFHFVQALVH
jgi:alpha-tubulin suppressor-like RCC1 family protein